MIELKFKQQNPQLGMVLVFLRIIGKSIYLKTNNNPYSENMINQMVSRGALISRGAGWIKIDMFNSPEQDYKIGKWEFNLKEVTEQEVEKILGEFYRENYIKAGFSLDG